MKLECYLTRKITVAYDSPRKQPGLPSEVLSTSNSEHDIESLPPEPVRRDHGFG